MKKTLLFSMLLLFGGVSMHAQSVSEEQMDERFNDGTKLPYGWFTEGWTVKDGAIQTASSGFDLGSLFNNDDENGSPDISSLLSSLMGGDSELNYLLTPPVVVNEGEKLVFSAKKEKKNSSFSFGSSDSTFVVERSVYSHNQWIRVADFTVELDTIYKTYTIPDTPAGEYRFRFKAAGTVLIDSVAGFHIDKEAPDIYVIENDARAKDVDFSLCTEDSTRSLTVINTATGTLKVDIASENSALFSVSPLELEVAAADSLDVDITFNFAAGQPGKNETQIVFTPADERVWGKTVKVTAVVTQPGVWAEDFNANEQPKGFFTEGWEFHDNVTTTNGGGMAAMFGFGPTTFLMTPPLKVESTDEVLLFSAKNGKSDDDMAGMFGGGSSVIVEKSVYGSNQWEKVREFTEPLDSAYRVLWVGYVEPGEYRFRIIASDSIVVDSIAGFHLDENAPDIYVLHNNTAARAIDFGMPQAVGTESLAIVNTGTGTLQVGAALTNEKDFDLSGNDFAIEANDTAYVNITYLFDEESLGIHQGAVTFTPTTAVLTPRTYPLTAYSTYADAWTEDFEPEFIPDDETEPRELPVDWKTTGWEVKLPGSDGGLMGMLSGMIGGGNSEPKTWMATTESEDYELITPRLQAKKGDVLRFEAKLGSGGLMDMMGGMMGGGGANGQLNVFYSLNNSDNWTYYNTFLQNGYVYFVAPSSGVYQLRFTSPGASLDNFYGLHKYIEETAPGTINLVDGETYEGFGEPVEMDTITYSRIFKNTNWQPWYVPFDMILTSELLEQFSFSRYAGTYTDDDGKFYLTVLRLKEGAKVKGNVPYFVQAKMADSNNAQVITVENTTLYPAEQITYPLYSADTKITVCGIYEPKYVTEDDRGWYAYSGGKYSLQNNVGNKVGPYRFFLRIAEREDNIYSEGVLPVEVKIKVLNEDETGIATIPIEEESQSIYDLQGRKVEKPTKGIYIINGKKVLY